MNKKASKEWLTKAWHNLSGARIFYDVNHYTDTIAVELHYAVEKTLKSFLAYQNQKIPKTHDLNKIHSFILDKIDFNESEYHIEESYPAFDRPLPSKEEIKEVLEFAEKLFSDVCRSLDIDKTKINAENQNN